MVESLVGKMAVVSVRGLLIPGQTGAFCAESPNGPKRMQKTLRMQVQAPEIHGSIPTLVMTELGQELGGDEYERNFQRERLSLIPAEPPQRAWKARSESEVLVHYGHSECGTCCLQVFLLGLLWKGT